ncbi:cubilin-like [Haliotis cracherodii]|uniref:cubilin-like n=1 Tax=Haliotis cracherodii TaxID=6455 RepID=UPI0039ECE61C
MALYTVAVVLLGILLPVPATTADACDKDIQLSYDVEKILSPAYPLFDTNLSCGWRINASSTDRLVGVKFVAKLQSTNCQHDSLSFYDGSDNSSGLLFQSCNNEVHRGSILSSGDTMYIQFTTDAVSNGIGFVLNVIDVERCGGMLTATSQKTNLTSPGFPYTSFNNLKCTWIITAENENDTVQVISDILVYYFGNSSASCKHEVVRVYDGNTTEADQFLGEFCSTQMPNFYSSTNSLLLEFTTDENITSKGFRMQYSSRPEGDCNGSHIIYNTPIYIMSPGYPDSYGSDMTCVISMFVMMQPPNMRLDVLTSDIEGNYPLCDTDYVRLLAGDGYGALYPVGTFCGDSSISPVGPYYSNGFQMKLLFKSNNDTRGKGFRLRVSHDSQKVIPHQSENCGPQYLNATTNPKFLHSPRYPAISLYPDNCIWTMSASNPSLLVRIVVIDLDDPTFNYVNVRCQYSVEFYNGPSVFNDTIFTWCGDSRPTLQSTGSSMTVQFQTIYASRLKGFILIYFSTNETYRCGGTVNITKDGNRTLTGPYQNSQDCHWTIYAPANTNIQVKVRNFNPFIRPMYPPKTCDADYVEIYDGNYDETGSSATGRWCGQYSTDYISSGHIITARFHSGIINKYRGIQIILKAGHFSASRTTDLSAYFSAQYITSPNYPFYYPSNIEPSWKIDAGEHNQVEIKVIFSHLESSVGCQNDYVEAFDGSDSKAPSLGRWCGGTEPNKTSSGTVMFLKFKSNSRVVDSGFSIKYTALCKGIYSTVSDVGLIAGASVAGVLLLLGIIGGIWWGCFATKKDDASSKVSPVRELKTESVSTKL